VLQLSYLASHFQYIFHVLAPQTSEKLAALVFTVGLGYTELGGALLSLHPLALLSSLVSNKIQRYHRYNIHCDRCTLLFQKNMKELCTKAFSFSSNLPPPPLPSGYIVSPTDRAQTDSKNK